MTQPRHEGFPARVLRTVRSVHQVEIKMMRKGNHVPSISEHLEPLLGEHGYKEARTDGQFRMEPPPAERHAARCLALVFLGAVQLADGIRLDLPSLEWHGGLVLSLAEFLPASAAHQRAFDVDVITLALPAAYAPRLTPARTTG